MDPLLALIRDLYAQLQQLTEDNQALAAALKEAQQGQAQADNNPGPVGMPTWDRSGPTGRATV